MISRNEFDIAWRENGLDSEVDPESFYKFYAMMSNNGLLVLRGAIDTEYVKRESEMDEVFAVYAGIFESWFDETFAGRKSEHYSDLCGVMYLLYDILLGIRGAYKMGSILSASLLARVAFELKVNLLEVEKNPSRNLPLFLKYAEIEKYDYELRKGFISEHEYISRVNALMGLCETTKKSIRKKIKGWTGVNNDSLFKIAKRNNCEKEYEDLYRICSTAAHGSSVFLNTYKNGGYSPIIKEKDIYPMVVLGLGVLKQPLLSLLNLVGLAEKEHHHCQISFDLAVREARSIYVSLQSNKFI